MSAVALTIMGALSSPHYSTLYDPTALVRTPISQSMVETKNIQSVLQDISSLAALEDDWDGMDALAVDERMLKQASNFVRRLNNAVMAQLRTVPEVAPTTTGGVGLSWFLPSSVLSLRFEPNEQRVVLALSRSGFSPSLERLPTLLAEKKVINILESTNYSI